MIRPALFALSLFALTALGTDIAPLPDGSLWTGVMDFIASIQGGSLYAIVAGIVELGVVFFRTSYGAALSGVWTQVVLYALSSLAFIVHGIASGTPILTILTNATLTSLVLNGGYELVKRLFPSLVPESK